MPFLSCGFASQTQEMGGAGLLPLRLLRKQLAARANGIHAIFEL
jgi:hypothetical protein